MLFRPYICHILYRLTRREDVLPFRIRKLYPSSPFKDYLSFIQNRYSIQERIGQESPLLSLLILYKQYFNDMVFVTKVKSRVSHIFKVRNSFLSHLRFKSDFEFRIRTQSGTNPFWKFKRNSTVNMFLEINPLDLCTKATPYKTTHMHPSDYYFI